MESKDLTLLAIASANSRLQPVQLQKSLFLLGEKVPENVLPKSMRYQFKAYDYGPFSADIYSHAEELEKEGLVSIVRSPQSRYKEYEITPAGLDRARSIASSDRSYISNYLAQLVAYTQSISFNQLVSSIYREFPEMKKNSVFNH